MAYATLADMRTVAPGISAADYVDFLREEVKRITAGGQQEPWLTREQSLNRLRAEIDRWVAVCPRCLDETPGKPAGDPARPHPGPFTADLCAECEAAS